MAIADQEAELAHAPARLPLIEKISRAKGGGPVNILTHCNAGWLACVEWGTATAPIYVAHEQGIDLHVWVDETRPLNQGRASPPGNWARPASAIRSSPTMPAATFMQHGRVDLVIVGTDRPPAPATWPTRSAPISRLWRPDNDV